MVMTSKKRVMCAIGLETPDRIPLDFGANPATLERLKNNLQVSGHADLLKALHVDIVDLRGVVDPVYVGPVPKVRDLGQGVKENFWGMRTTVKQSITGPEEMYCDFILQKAESLEELEAYRWPEVDWFDFSDFKNRLRCWQDFAVMASGVSIWQHATFLRSLDVLLMDLISRPEIGEYLIDKFTNFYLTYFDKMFSEANGMIDILRIADDIGMQNGLLIGPNIFIKFLAPRIKKFVDMAHSYGIKVMFHSCGSIVPLIDKLIEMEIDILDPLQVTAKDMDPQFLKNTFGHRICLHGSIDTQYILPQGRVEEVIENVKTMIKILGKDGGFILAPSHVLQTDVPMENVIAMYETGFKFGDKFPTSGT